MTTTQYLTNCHQPNSEGSGSAWKAYINARVLGLFLLVLLEYLNGKGVVRATSRGLDMAPHWSGVGAAPLMSPRQDETSEPLLYAGWMAGPYWCKDATRGRNDDPGPGRSASKPQEERLRIRFHEYKGGLSSSPQYSSGDLKREIHDLRDSFMGEITKIREEFGEEVSTLHQVIEGLQADMALCKQSLASSGGNTNHGPKIDVLKPLPFVGKREARAVDDFLWEMEQYLEGVNVVDDASKIKMATEYLKDMLWWRRRYGDIERGTATIDTWVEFVADFKKQFYPENAKNEAKSQCRKLKQSGTIQEYVKEFTTLVLEISELSDQDSLFYFLDGLQGWAKTDTRRESSKPKDQKVNQEKGGGEKNAQPKADPARKPPTGKDKNLKTSYKSGG
ncbi:putative retrotransposon gag domain, aspartic peptidase domain protein [Tanacetum coccineum]